LATAKTVTADGTGDIIHGRCWTGTTLAAGHAPSTPATQSSCRDAPIRTMPPCR
jgi:hypothetical protein